MKLIKITQADIDNNKRLLKGKNVGQILQFTKDNFPKVWNNISVNYNSDLEHFGFKTPVKPELQANEKYGKILEVNGDFIFDIEQVHIKTQEEIEQDEDNDTSIIQAKKLDGSTYYDKIKRRLERKLFREKINQSQFDKVYTDFRKALIWCNTGDFDLSLIEMNILTYNNDKLEELRLQVIDELTNFNI